ncbi:MAG: FtsX-like permease family protein [Fulvivirga sp.]|uniref:ABC transporter permease n=1 Tax=Fulvivirga sp. TaxID=1931237 RepID=UPI0032EB517E
MFRNYFITAFRSLHKNKMYSFINVMGLALGMLACFFILQYVVFELSYDTHHKNSETIYRVTLNSELNNDGAAMMATNFITVGPLLKSEFESIEDYLRIYYLDRHAIIRHKDDAFSQKGIVYADPSVFDFFTYSFLTNDSKGQLEKPNTAIISSSLAKKLFGTNEAVGEFIQLNEETNSFDLLITGVFEDVPHNTHLKTEMVVSLSTIENLRETKSNEWRWPLYLTYIRVGPNSDISDIENSFNAFVDTYFLNNRDGLAYSLGLQHIEDIHLYSNLAYEIEQNISAKLVYFLLITGIMILVIAYLNFVNLSTVKFLERLKEVGIRKALGSNKLSLIYQFLVGSFLLNLVAMALAILLSFILAPYYTDITSVSIEKSLVTNHLFWLIVFLTIVVGTISSSLYPAYRMASSGIINSLKGISSKGFGSSRLRQIMVVIQFACSIGLLIIAYAVYEQIEYVQNQPLGFRLERQIIIESPRLETHKKKEITTDPFIQKLVNQASITGVTVSSSVPGIWTSRMSNVKKVGKLDNNDESFYLIGVDENFMHVYDIQILAGRNFNNSDQDNQVLVLSELAIRELGFTDPEDAISQKIEWNNKVYEIIGVASNYHHYSLRENIKPFVFQLDLLQKEYYTINYSKQSDLDFLVDDLRASWASVFPESPFQFFFLNESFAKQYESELMLKKIVGFFTLLALIIACLGLFGLSSYTISRRTKEIGVRKVLGSSVLNIVVLILKDYVKLVFVAALVTIPFVTYLIYLWLNEFAYKTPIKISFILWPTLTVVAIALLTVSYKTFRAARINPVRSLKYE